MSKSIRLGILVGTSRYRGKIRLPPNDSVREYSLEEIEPEEEFELPIEEEPIVPKQNRYNPHKKQRRGGKRKVSIDKLEETSFKELSSKLAKLVKQITLAKKLIVTEGELRTINFVAEDARIRFHKKAKEFRTPQFKNSLYSLISKL